MNDSTAVIILAAGLGKRMKSDKAKVLHEIKGRPMIHYIVETAHQVVGNNIVVVVGHQAERVKETVTTCRKVRFALQNEQLGTGHATQCALPEISAEARFIIILCGDVPLLKAETLIELIQVHKASDNQVTGLAVEMENPKGYGRMVINEKGHLIKIVEEKDATDGEKGIRLINSGIYCAGHDFLENALKKIDNQNAQNEFYLTDIIEIANREGRSVGVLVKTDPTEVIGINTLEELSRVEGLI